MRRSYFPHWRYTTHTQVGPQERLSWTKTFAMGIQHVIAMFGSTVLAPIMMGFDPNVAILMSGVGTLIFFILVKGRVPSYLGSSFAFIAGVMAVTGYEGPGLNAHISKALGGIIVCGAFYALVGVMVWAFSHKAVKWIDHLMPPVVTGSVVAVIGLNLAPIAVKAAMGSTPFETAMALTTILCVSMVAVFGKGMIQKLPILIGLILSAFIYVIFSNILGYGKPMDFSLILTAPWFGFPHFVNPEFHLDAIGLLAPVSLILVAENLGHIKAVSAMTGQNMDNYIGRAFVGDGLATMLSGSVGGTGVTTYAENIGVMAVTRVFSTLVFVAAALFAVLLGFSPKFGALIGAIPGPVLGGTSVVVFGLIAISGAKIWVDNRVDFSYTPNLLVASVTLILGAGDFGFHIGTFVFGGIGTATFGAILLYALLQGRWCR